MGSFWLSWALSVDKPGGWLRQTKPKKKTALPHLTLRPLRTQTHMGVFLFKVRPAKMASVFLLAFLYNLKNGKRHTHLFDGVLV